MSNTPRTDEVFYLIQRTVINIGTIITCTYLVWCVSVTRLHTLTFKFSRISYYSVLTWIAEFGALKLLHQRLWRTMGGGGGVWEVS